MAELQQNVKLSVLVPAYNMAPYLAQCIDSILEQKVNFKYQILIGEDCSTDKTREVCRDYEKKYPGLITVFYNPANLGPSSNLCTLIDQVNTELFIQIDGDDYVTDSSKLQLQVDTMEEQRDCAMCFHNYGFVDSNGNNPRAHSSLFAGDCVLPKDYLLYHDLGPGNLVMIRRSALPRPLPKWMYGCGYQIDYVVHTAAAAEGRIFYIDKVMTAYRKHPLSITVVTKKKYILEMMILNPLHLASYYKSKGLNAEASNFRSFVPKRYMILSYFYLSEGKLFNFMRYFLKGFIGQPTFKLNEHKDMVYSASPEMAQKLKKWFHWKG